jgi:sugar lactone lactonase YvrE
MKIKAIAAVGSTSVLCGVALLGLCLANALPASAAPASPACEELGPPIAEPPVPQQIVTFDPAIAELPESMTADSHGNLFVSTIGGFVREIRPDHSVVPIATIPLPTGGLLTGIKLGPDGLLYVGSASFTADPPAAFVWRVNPRSGEVEKFATLAAEGFPNELLFDDEGNLLVADPFLGLIWQIDRRGQPSVWFSDPLLVGDPTAPAFGVHDFGVDGLAFDANKKDLYIGNVDFGRILILSPSGHHGLHLSVLVEDPALKGVDGIALDRSGTLFAAVNTQDRLATVDRRGRVRILAEGAPLDGPSSFAFGTGRQDRHTLYIANFAINRFLAGEPANPGVLSLPVEVPGLPLP